MPQEFLDSPNVVAILKEMGGERMAKTVTPCGLRDPGGQDAPPNGPLKHGFMQVVPPPSPSHRIQVEARRRENPLPPPFPWGARILPLDGLREFGATSTSV